VRYDGKRERRQLTRAIEPAAGRTYREIKEQQREYARERERQRGYEREP
jgi:hypothetical protein